MRSIDLPTLSDNMALLDKTSTALDFNYANNEVFYSDREQRKLFMFTLPSLNDSGNDVQVVSILGYCLFFYYSAIHVSMRHM